MPTQLSVPPTPRQLVVHLRPGFIASGQLLGLVGSAPAGAAEHVGSWPHLICTSFSQLPDSPASQGNKTWAAESLLHPVLL